MEKSPALDGHGNARRGSRAFAAVRCGGRPQGQTPAETQTPPTPGAAIYPVSGSVPAASSIRATQAKRANPNQTIMNETICSITSALEEGHSWGHSDEAIARYIYETHILPLERRLAAGPDAAAAFLEGFMLTTEHRNGHVPFAGDYAEAWMAIAPRAAASEAACRAVNGDAPGTD